MLGYRDEKGTVFSRASWPRWPQLRLYGLALLLTVLVTEVGFLQRIFLSTSLTVNQWLLCTGVALVLLAVEETAKFVLRGHQGGQAPAEVGNPRPAQRGSAASSH